MHAHTHAHACMCTHACPRVDSGAEVESRKIQRNGQRQVKLSNAKTQKAKSLKNKIGSYFKVQRSPEVKTNAFLFF